MILGALAAFAALAALAAPAGAVEAVPLPADSATPQEVTAKLNVCEACHGPNGMSKSVIIPIIAGQRKIISSSSCMTSMVAYATSKS
jgi:cytochrome c553